MVCLEVMLLDGRYAAIDLEVNGLELEDIEDARLSARWKVVLAGGSDA